MAKLKRIFSFFFLGLLCACTNNPFDNDNDIKADNVQIIGQVSIRDDASPERVYVWLKGYNIGTFTDENGNYTLRLPAEQRGGSGTVQRDTLYFYLANYFIETAQVDIIEGEFRYFSADLDKDGRVRDIEMRRSLRITTTVEITHPQAQPTPKKIVVLVRVRGEDGCRIVQNPLVGQQTTQRVVGDTTALDLGAALVKNLDSDALYIVRVRADDLGPERMNPCDYDTYHRKLEFFAEDIGLPAGRYEAIPYLWFEPENVPAGLLDKMGRHFDELNANYLQKPMKRVGGTFELQ